MNLRFVGPEIIYSPFAEKEVDRLFPKSKHRSKRIKKKLEKRFGGPEFRLEACLYQFGEKIIAHPCFKQDIEKAFSEVSHNQLSDTRFW